MGDALSTAAMPVIPHSPASTNVEAPLSCSLPISLHSVQLRPQRGADWAGGRRPHCGHHRCRAGALQAPACQVGSQRPPSSPLLLACRRAIARTLPSSLPRHARPLPYHVCWLPLPIKATAYPSTPPACWPGTRSSCATSGASTPAWCRCCRPTPSSGAGAGRCQQQHRAIKVVLACCTVTSTACWVSFVGATGCSRLLNKHSVTAALPAACCSLRSTGVRLICTNQVGNGARTTVVNTQNSTSIRWAVVQGDCWPGRATSCMLVGRANGCLLATQGHRWSTGQTLPQLGCRSTLPQLVCWLARVPAGLGHRAGLMPAWRAIGCQRCTLLCRPTPPCRDNILAVFGSKAADAMQPLHVSRDVC